MFRKRRRIKELERRIDYAHECSRPYINRAEILEHHRVNANRLELGQLQNSTPNYLALAAWTFTFALGVAFWWGLYAVI